MYIFKYPEENHRSDGEPWSIRKTAVYHQLDKSTGKSVYVVVSPLADSAGAQALLQWLKNLNDLESCKTNAFAINQILLSTYQPGFRSYAMFYEKKIKALVRDPTPKLVLQLTSFAAHETDEHWSCRR
jgi:hypothetical protein